MTSTPSSPLPFKRRNFFVKQGFQTRFALYPIGLFSLFLLGSGVYLHGNLRETLEFHLYMPHSQLQNPWEVVGPAVLRVAGAGTAAFLIGLGVWGWRRFSRLHSDFEALAAWAGPLAGGGSAGPLPRLGDPEVRALGEGLDRAARGFEVWDREVTHRIESLREAMESVGSAEVGEVGGAIARAQEQLSSLSHALSVIRVEEDLG